MKKFLSLAVVMTPVLLMVGCSDHGDSLEVTGPPIGPPPISFASDIQPIFSSNCLGCHGEGGNGGLDLRAGQSYGNLVGVAASGGTGNRVEPSDAPASFLYLRLSDQGGGGMPPASPLPAETVAKVAEWINDGAANN